MQRDFPKYTSYKDFGVFGHEHKDVMVQLWETSCGQVNVRGHFRPVILSPTCVLIGHESVCL